MKSSSNTVFSVLKTVVKWHWEINAVVHCEWWRPGWKVSATWFLESLSSSHLTPDMHSFSKSLSWNEGKTSKILCLLVSAFLRINGESSLLTGELFQDFEKWVNLLTSDEDFQGAWQSCHLVESQ